MKGELYLIPSNLGDGPLDRVIPTYIKQTINTIDSYIVEDIRTARRFLIKAGIEKKIDDLSFYELNEHTTSIQSSGYLKPALEGKNIGLISEAGCPAVADPGSDIVKMAHKQGIKVRPLVGPSSILLALMASGMNGQNFAFIGYLPVKRPERTKRIKFLETRSKLEKQTQIFIETPYRNMQLLEEILNSCNPQTTLCIASNLTEENEFIQTKTIMQWRENPPDIHKQPAIFLLQA